MDKRIYYLIIWFLHIILIIFKLDWIALGEKWVLIILLEIPLAVLAFAFVGDMRLERKSRKYLKLRLKVKPQFVVHGRKLRPIIFQTGMKLT